MKSELKNVTQPICHSCDLELEYIKSYIPRFTEFEKATIGDVYTCPSCHIVFYYKSDRPAFIRTQL